MFSQLELSRYFNKGEFSLVPDNKGNIFIVDGDIYVFSKDGRQTDFIHLPERPATIAFGGKERNILFATCRTTLYAVDLTQKP